MIKSLAVAAIALAGAFPASPVPLRAQDDLDRPPPSTGIPLIDEARREQRAFERFRIEHLPQFNGKGANSTNDKEIVGRFQYWYNENEPPAPPEPAATRLQRQRLIGILDTAATKYPEDDWLAGQRIRYLSEEGLTQREVGAALACRAEAWWCGALLGFAYHENREYVRADSAFAGALRQMPDRQRCDWTDISVLLDEYTLNSYHRLTCGTADRLAYENRMWFLSKPLYAMTGVDTRTEYYARMTMVRMLEMAPNAFQFGFDIDERELLLRYGWPRGWSEERAGPVPNPRAMGLGGRGGMGYGGGGGEPPRERPVNVVSHEPSPSYQFLMPGTTSNSPAMTDSVDWETGVAPVHARYAPAYARRIGGLQHQSAMFRRGDSSLVVLAWDASTSPIIRGKAFNMALVLARSDSLKPTVTKKENVGLTGYMIGRGPWSQLLMSAELTSPGVDTVVRARYGLRPPFGMGARVTLSEMLFFKEYDNDALPNTVEEAAPHAMASIKMRNDQKLGIFFESYGTNPAGEKLKVSFTVAREEDEPGFVRRRLQSMRLSSDAKPLRTTLEDQSRIGERMTPRAAYVDVRQLKKGSYIVQLEVEVAGQYVVRTERALEITN